MARVSSKHQDVLKILRDLSGKDPHLFLQSVANVIRLTINCETACILLWDDQERLLITQYHSGLPKKLIGRERYEYDQGFTGKYVFKQGAIRRGLVDFTNEIIKDVDRAKPIRDRSIRWDHMQRYKENSRFKDFKSLLCVPLSVRSEKLGVIKLINRLHSDKNHLDPRGFKLKDVRALRLFLDSIEHVVETKIHEDRIEEFHNVSKEIANSEFNYVRLLSKVAGSCARAMNSTLCVIRLVDGLVIKGPAAEDRPWNKDPNPSFAIKCALAENTVVKWSTKSGVIDTVDGKVLSKDKPLLAADGIRSFVMAPVTYQNRAVGTIECYSSLPRRFASRELEVVESFGSSLVSSIFQRQRVAEALDGLSKPFALFANVDELYTHLVSFIEKYLQTDAVSIWNKSAKEPHKLELARASNSIWQDYQGAKIRELLQGSFTASVLSAGKVKELSYRQIGSKKFAYSDFARRHKFRSATMVPVGTGRHAHAVIDVFYYRDRRLFPEEKNFLELLAAKAASAMQRIKLIEAFNSMHYAWSDGDLKTTLKRITTRALGELHADIVMLFYYDSEAKQFLPTPVWDGELFDKGMIEESTVIEEDDLVNHIRRHGTRYFKDYGEYVRSLSAKDATPRDNDFWHRENIHSSAGIQLKHSNDVLGVIWFNYHEDEPFEEGTRNLIQAFATLAASEIASAKLLGEKREFETNQQAEQLALSMGRVRMEMADRAAAILHSISLAFGELDGQLKDPAKGMKADIDQFRGTVRDAIMEFNDLRPALETAPVIGQESMEECDLGDLIDKSLAAVTGLLEEAGITIERELLTRPKIRCVRIQVSHMLRALCLSARKAKRNNQNGEVRRLRIKLRSEKRFARIDVSNHPGIIGAPEKVLSVQPVDDDPDFRLCLRIAKSHGGDFKLVGNAAVNGWTASIRLPLESRGA